MKSKYVRYVFSTTHGIFMFRLFGKFYKVKAPWNAPLFSEREGCDNVKVSAFGWRFMVREVGK